MIKGNLLYFYLHVIVIDGLRTACDIVMGQEMSDGDARLLQERKA